MALFVDAIQGLGPLTIDVARTPIDFLCADGHKWLLGPEGAGFLYVRAMDRAAAAARRGLAQRDGSYNAPKVEFTPQAQRPAVGGRLVQHARPAGAGGEPPPVPRDRPARRSRDRILDRAEAVREVARSAGWTVFGSDRPEDLSGIVPLTKEGVDPDAVRPLGSAIAASRWPAAGAGCGSARTSTTTTTTSTGLREALS